MKNLFNGVLATFALTYCLSSCSPYVLEGSRVLNDADPTSYKSFSIQPVETENLPEDINEKGTELLYSVVADELKSRGYTQSESSGELTVFLSLSTKQSLETSTSGTGFGVDVGYGYGGMWGGRYAPLGVPPAVPYTHGVYSVNTNTTSTTEVVTDGVLMLDLVDSKTNTHIFCAEISARVDGSEFILRDRAELTKAIDKLFKKFPTKK